MDAWQAITLLTGVCFVVGAVLGWLGLHSRLCMKPLPKPDHEILCGELPFAVLSGRFAERMRRIVYGVRGEGLWRIATLYGVPIALVMGIEAGRAPALSMIDIACLVVLIGVYVLAGCTGCAIAIEFTYRALPRRSDPVGDVWSWSRMLRLLARCLLLALLIGPIRTVVCASLFVVVISRDPIVLLTAAARQGVFETGFSSFMVVENLFLLMPCVMLCASVVMAAAFLGARDIRRVANAWFMRETADRHKRQSMLVAVQIGVTIGIGLIAVSFT